MLGVHHVSPFRHVPADFPGDPMFSRVNRLWRHTPSVYGPLFSGVSAVGAWFYGVSPLRARLFYQALAGASLLGSAALLVRRRVALWVVVLVILAPGVVAAVNTAHVDVIVGLGLLAGLLLVVDRRWAAAGAVLGLTALVKIVALPAVVGVLVALLVARRWRPLLTVAGVVALVSGAGYLVAGGSVALRPDAHGTDYISKASIMNGLHELHDLAHTGPWPLLTHSAVRSLASLAVAAVVFGAFLWRRRRTPDPATLAVGAMVIYLLTANYVLPWYAVAAVPLAALVGSRLRWLLISIVVLLQFAWVQGDHRHLPAALLIAHVAPIVEVVMLVLLVWWPAGLTPGRSSGTAPDAGAAPAPGRSARRPGRDRAVLRPPTARGTWRTG